MTATVPSFAKLNLDLRVLHKRSDNYHELRTIFQTISLKDTLVIQAERSRKTDITLDCSHEIADNLVVRAARAVLDYLKINAHVDFSLRKRIPMGAGLGGGSSNAAAVLLALPALLNKPIPEQDLIAIAGKLGSDVPFFLLAGTAIALGRGTELYPLPDIPAHHAVVVSTGIHVSTAEAYGALARSASDSLTSGADSPILREFQTIAWNLGVGLDQFPLTNDFEAAVFTRHPELAAVVRKLRRAGAKVARMTGSGSAVFGVFDSASEARNAAARWPVGVARSRRATRQQTESLAAPRQLATTSAELATPVRFLSRRQYKTLWLKALGPAAANSLFNA